MKRDWFRLSRDSKLTRAVIIKLRRQGEKTGAGLEIKNEGRFFRFFSKGV